MRINIKSVETGASLTPFLKESKHKEVAPPKVGPIPL